MLKGGHVESIYGQMVQSKLSDATDKNWREENMTNSVRKQYCRPREEEL